MEGKDDQTYYKCEALSVFGYLPIDFIDHGQITLTLKEQEFLFLHMTLIVIN